MVLDFVYMHIQVLTSNCEFAKEGKSFWIRLDALNFINVNNEYNVNQS